MADQKENEEVKEDEAKEQNSEETASSSSKANIVMWAILATVVLIGFSGGYGAARIFASSEQQAEEVAAQQQEEEEKAKLEEPLVEPTKEEENSWEFPLDTVIANLDEPGVTRYVRAALILRISNDLPEAEYKAVLESKKSELVDWLYSYMAGLSLEDVQGTRNLERFKLEVQKNFNDLLFPDSKPMIIRILTKEFQIQ